jgi:hypothetical protein
MIIRRFADVLACACLAAAAFAANAASDDSSSSAALREKYAQLRERIERNAFGRPLHLDSGDASGALRGDVYAVLEHPFRRVSEGLAQAPQWCEVLTLPFNVQRCEPGGDALSLYIGRKPGSPIEEATKLNFKYSIPARSADYLQVRLAAPSGPLGTRDYNIRFEAAPLDDKRTVVHMHYGYAHGAMSKMAMQTYLAGSGADKVGFTSEGRDEQGKTKLVGGMRGVMERNTMRYFLAIEAYLDALTAPREGRLRARLDKWFAATERYARQLREMSREEYLALKQKGASAVSPQG